MEIIITFSIIILLGLVALYISEKQKKQGLSHQPHQPTHK